LNASRAGTYVHPRHITFDQNALVSIANARNGSTIPFDPNSFITSKFQSQSGSVLACGMCRPVAVWWAIMLQVQEWMFSSAQDWGSPFLVIKYARSLIGNTAELDRLEEFLTTAGSNKKLMVPMDSEGEVVMPGNLGPDNPNRYLKDQADKEVQQLILGQTSSTTGTPGKLGSGEHAQRREKDYPDFPVTHCPLAFHVCIKPDFSIASLVITNRFVPVSVTP